MTKFFFVCLNFSIGGSGKDDMPQTRRKKNKKKEKRDKSETLLEAEDIMSGSMLQTTITSDLITPDVIDDDKHKKKRKKSRSKHDLKEIDDTKILAKKAKMDNDIDTSKRDDINERGNDTQTCQNDKQTTTVERRPAEDVAEHVQITKKANSNEKNESSDSSSDDIEVGENKNETSDKTALKRKRNRRRRKKKTSAQNQNKSFTWNQNSTKPSEQKQYSSQHSFSRVSMNSGRQRSQVTSKNYSNQSDNKKHIKFGSDSEAEENLDSAAEMEHSQENVQSVSSANIPSSENATNVCLSTGSLEKSIQKTLQCIAEYQTPQNLQDQSSMEFSTNDNQQLTSPDIYSYHQAPPPIYSTSPQEGQGDLLTILSSGNSGTPSFSGKAKKGKSGKQGGQKSDLFGHAQVFDRRKNKKKGFVPLTKQEQINTMATNKSVIIQVCILISRISQIYKARVREMSDSGMGHIADIKNGIEIVLKKGSEYHIRNQKYGSHCADLYVLYYHSNKEVSCIYIRLLFYEQM